LIQDEFVATSAYVDVALLAVPPPLRHASTIDVTPISSESLSLRSGPPESPGKTVEKGEVLPVAATDVMCDPPGEKSTCPE
jgi:hypothetical protein